jgi:hypothetical protein
MDAFTRLKATEYLQTLVNQPLLFAIKSPDTELYDFEFGKEVVSVNRHGNPKRVGTHILHILCRFEIIRKTGEPHVDWFYEDTSSELFHSEVQHLMGLKVIRTALSDKNDLWLDFGDYWVVFATFNTGDESWRFFTSEKTTPHLVASDCWLEFVD